MCNVYRRFVKGSAKIVAPLNQRTGMNQLFEFVILTDEKYDTFEAIKNRLVSISILALPSYGKT